MIITNHFEDTPREAVKAKTLAASLLLQPIFFERKSRQQSEILFFRGWVSLGWSELTSRRSAYAAPAAAFFTVGKLCNASSSF
jgi:hypothetical protein